MEHDVYLKERDLLIDAEREAARSFDKTMTTLAAGALALSFGFVREMKVAPSSDCLLYWAWGAFVVSLLLILVSFLLSQHAMRRQIAIIEESFDLPNSSAPKITRWAKVIIALNWVSLISLVIGVVFFAVFAACNLFRSNSSCPN